MKIKPSHFSHINLPFKLYRDKFWCIAVLFSLYISLSIHGTIVASTVQQTSAGLQTFPLTKEYSGGRLEHFGSISKIEPASENHVGSAKQSEPNKPNHKQAKIQADYGKLPLYFIQNDGQLDDKVKFYEKGGGHAMFFTEEGVYLFLAGEQKQYARSQKFEGRNQKQDASRTSVPLVGNLQVIGGKGEDGIVQNSKCKVQSLNSEIPDRKLSTCSSQLSTPQLVRLIPIGANKNPEIIAEGIQEGTVNYFVGNDKERWKTNIPTYQAVVYKDVYKDIDLKFYGNNRQLEYDIIVKPGACPTKVKLAFEGIDGLRVTEVGNLEISTKGWKVIQKKPYVYQEINGEKVEVQGKFKILGTKYGVKNRKLKTRHPSRFIYSFQVASYDKHSPLIIDPALEYSTYLGGSRIDVGHGIVADTSGNAYVTGHTMSYNFPTASAVDESFTGGSDGDAFITKLNASGSNLVYSTYFGGNDWDEGKKITVDTNGNVYVTGQTSSTNFPTASALYGSNAGNGDAFVTKLNATGDSIIYSTYLGGSGFDAGYGITVDISENTYITGITYSSNFPMASAIYGSYGGNGDAFVTKLNASGNNLVYSTYLGGSGDDGSYGGIAIDISENALVTGYTSSTNFPTVSAINRSNAGDFDVFVAKLDSLGSSLVYSTYLGGNASDNGYGIAVDTSGNAYITGYTSSTNFPTSSAIYGSYAGGGDVFVTKLNTSGDGLVYSTYLGGSGMDSSGGIVIDNSENAYLTGFTYSSNFPIVSAIYGSNAGSYDAFITKLDASGSSLVYSTYLGGGYGDKGDGIAVDTSGNVYITGSTYSSNFPTASALYGSLGDGGGYGDAFVTKISSDSTKDITAPTVSTGSVTNVTTSTATLNGTVNANGQLTTAWFQYDTTSGSYSNTSSTQSTSVTSDTTVSIDISGLSADTTYYYRIAAQNSAGTTYGSEMSFTTGAIAATPRPTPTPSSSDTTAPKGSVSINSGASYTNSTTVTLNLSATDNAGVTGYYSSTSSTTPSVSTSGWTSINSTTSYTADASYTVSSGDGSKAVYVWYKDNSGNVSNTASDEITLDTIITTPTSSSTYTTTSSTMNMDGTAFDNASGISSVTWSNSKGGNGTATGTTLWSVSSITLSSGDNTITVTAKDNAGNTGTDAIAVTYSGGTVSSPTPTSTPTPKPTPKTSPSPTKTPAITPVVTAHPTPTPSPTPIQGKGVVLGFVYDLDSESLLGVDVTIAGNNYSGSTETDSNGYYEFDGLAAGDYTLTYEKEGYETQTVDISLEEENVFVVDDVTMEEIEKGKIYGYVVKIDGDTIESVRLKLKGVITKVVKNTSSDADGFFEFTGLGADTYVIFARKMRYKKAKATVKLEEEESKEIEIEMKRTSKRLESRSWKREVRRKRMKGEG